MLCFFETYTCKVDFIWGFLHLMKIKHIFKFIFHNCWFKFCIHVTDTTAYCAKVSGWVNVRVEMNDSFFYMCDFTLRSNSWPVGWTGPSYTEGWSNFVWFLCIYTCFWCLAPSQIDINSFYSLVRWHSMRYSIFLGFHKDCLIHFKFAQSVVSFDQIFPVIIE